MPIRGLISNRSLLTSISLKNNGNGCFNITLLPLNEEIRASEDIIMLTLKVKENVGESINIFKGWQRKFATKVCLLGYDLEPKVEVLKLWLGEEYHDYFTKKVRDIRTLEFFFQDVRAFNSESKYEEPNLTRFAGSLGFEDPYFRLPQRECLLLAEVYRRLLHKMG